MLSSATDKVIQMIMATEYLDRVGFYINYAETKAACPVIIPQIKILEAAISYLFYSGNIIHRQFFQ